MRHTWLVFDLDGTLLDDVPGAKTRWFGNEVKAFPGALRTLRWARRQGYELILYSMGDIVSRLRRLAAAGIPRDLFRFIYAPSSKTPETYRHILAPHQRGARLVYVGDSWKHDVAVALGRADAVVWVRGGRQPGVKDTPADPESYPVWIVDSVADLPGVLPQVLADGYRGQRKAAWKGYWEREFGWKRWEIDATPARGRPRRQMVLDLDGTTAEDPPDREGGDPAGGIGDFGLPWSDPEPLDPSDLIGFDEIPLDVDALADDPLAGDGFPWVPSGGRGRK